MPVEITCENCQKNFSVRPSRSEARFCSMECRSEYSLVELNCEQCGNAFEVRKFNSDRQYCSTDCQYKSMEKENPTVICENCGDEYSVKPSEEDRTRFCSRKCAGAGITPDFDKEEVTLTCAWCNEEFKTYPYREGVAVTCSWECRAEYLSDEMRESDPDIRKTKEYRDWRNEVLSGHESCVECDNEQRLYAHHIVPISECKEKATDVDNGVALCKDCHAEKHPEIEELIKRNPY